jgi:hypothetical protein
MSKAAQGFSLRRTYGTPQTETRGERNSSGKELFMKCKLICLRILPPSLSDNITPRGPVYKHLVTTLKIIEYTFNRGLCEMFNFVQVQASGP